MGVEPESIDLNATRTLAIEGKYIEAAQMRALWLKTESVATAQPGRAAGGAVSVPSPPSRPIKTEKPIDVIDLD